MLHFLPTGNQEIGMKAHMNNSFAKTSAFRVEKRDSKWTMD